MITEQKGLRLAAALTFLTGLALALAAWPPANLPVRLLVDLVIRPVDRAEALATPEARIGRATSCGVMAGWGAMIRQTAGDPCDRAPGTMRRIVLGSPLIWSASTAWHRSGPGRQ